MNTVSLKRSATALASGVSIAVLGFQLAFAASTIIDNGTVQLGINDVGTLVDSAHQIGLTYLPTHGEALAPGCDCEGWGIGDLNDLTHVYGVSQSNSTVNVANGTATLTVSGTGTDGLSAGSSAISVVDISMNDAAWAKVTQDFHPSTTPFLYEDHVTIKNTGTTAIGNLIYRRAMDWDVPPTEFEEIVTIQGWPAANLIHSSDDGFHSLDINDSLVGSGIAANTEDQNFTNSGPDDHGAAFDFSFGSLAPDASKDFKIFYGAAGNPADALAALQNVGAEVYSLGMPSNFGTGDPEFGTPNTFIFGFAGVGGVPVGGAPVSVTSLGLMRQLTTVAARHHDDAIGMRMNGTSGGGDVLNFGNDADALGWKGFVVAGMSHGDFTEVPGTKSKYNLDHFDVGADYTFDDMWPNVNNLRVGASVGTTVAEAGGAQGTLRYGRIETDGTISGSLYASARVLDHGYVQVTGTIGSFGYDIQRVLGADTFTGYTRVSEHDVSIRGGYDFQIDWADLGIDAMPTKALSAGPIAEADYISGTIGHFQESSVTRPLNALIFPESSFSTWITQLGARVNYAEQIDGNTYGVTVKAAWEHQFKDSASLVANSVGSLPSLASFDVRGADNARVGARIFMTTMDNLVTFGLEDDITMGPTGHDNSVTFQFRLRF